MNRTNSSSLKIAFQDTLDLFAFWSDNNAMLSLDGRLNEMRRKAKLPGQLFTSVCSLLLYCPSLLSHLRMVASHWPLLISSAARVWHGMTESNKIFVKYGKGQTIECPIPCLTVDLRGISFSFLIFVIRSEVGKGEMKHLSRVRYSRI